MSDAMRKALEDCRSLLMHLYTVGGGRYALHPDSPDPQRVIDEVSEALAALDAEPKRARVQPCGCVVCTCGTDDRCLGCGAKNCGTPECVFRGACDRIVYTLAAPAPGATPDCAVCGGEQLLDRDAVKAQRWDHGTRIWLRDGHERGRGPGDSDEVAAMLSPEDAAALGRALSPTPAPAPGATTEGARPKPERRLREALADLCDLRARVSDDVEAFDIGRHPETGEWRVWHEDYADEGSEPLVLPAPDRFREGWEARGEADYGKLKADGRWGFAMAAESIRSLTPPKET